MFVSIFVIGISIQIDTKRIIDRKRTNELSLSRRPEKLRLPFPRSGTWNGAREGTYHTDLERYDRRNEAMLSEQNGAIGREREKEEEIERFG